MLVSWSLKSLFSTGMVIAETKIKMVRWISSICIFLEAGPNLTCLQARTCLEIWNPCLKKVAIGTKQALLNFTLGNTEYSEKYNLQKFEDSRSFVVIYSEYSQLTEGDISEKMRKIAGKFVISVHVFLRFFHRDGGTFTHVPLWLRACAVCAMEFR